MNKEILTRLAGEFGTPCYIFDTDEFERRAGKVREAFGEKTGLCFSIKANPFMLKKLPSVFSHIEVCSPGELTICEKTGADMKKVIFSGVNKTYEDVERAVCDGVGLFTAESKLHMEYINKCALSHNKTVPVILRVSNGSQFGMDEADVFDIIKSRSAYPGCDIIGLHYFTGTQKKKAKLIGKELDYLDELICRLKDEFSFETKHVEYGTGLATDYFSDPTDGIDMSLLEEVSVHIRNFSEKYNLTVEMGRFFAVSCGTYLTRVMDIKKTHDINYAICDGGIHHIKYDGQTMAMQVPFMTVLTDEKREAGFWSLCGSLCTTADVLVRKAELPQLELGDVIAFHRVGAYSVMEGISLLLSRKLPRVVLYSEKDGAVMVRDFYDTDILNTP